MRHHWHQNARPTEKGGTWKLTANTDVIQVKLVGVELCRQVPVEVTTGGMDRAKQETNSE